MDELLDWMDEDYVEMSFEQYAEEAMNLAIYEDDLLYPLIGLCSEVGEVADKFKKMMRDERLELPLDDPAFTLNYEQRQAIAKELGDVLWYVTALAGDIGYGLEDIAVMNLEKLRDRNARDVITGSGDDR